MAFFDNSVCCETNDKLVKAMDQVDLEKHSLGHATLNVISVAQLENKSVTDFVTRNINSLFTKLPASQWAENHDCQTAAVVASTVAAVNDHAERGIVLIHQLSGSWPRMRSSCSFCCTLLPGNAQRKQHQQRIAIKINLDKSLAVNIIILSGQSWCKLNINEQTWCYLAGEIQITEPHLCAWSTVVLYCSNYFFVTNNFITD